MRVSLRRRPKASCAKSIAAKGIPVAMDAACVGAVVDMLTVTVEFLLPDDTCEGLKLHDVNAGIPAQETVASEGKFPVLGSKVTLKRALFPGFTVTVAGVADIEKSNV
jgi:hypothetical protein